MFSMSGRTLKTHFCNLSSSPVEMLIYGLPRRYKFFVDDFAAVEEGYEHLFSPSTCSFELFSDGGGRSETATASCDVWFPDNTEKTSSHHL